MVRMYYSFCLAVSLLVVILLFSGCTSAVELHPGCLITQEDHKLIMRCAGGSYSEIPLDQYSEIETITLCPERNGAYKQVLFRIDDKLYTIYTRRGTRLAEIGPGNYRSTDGRNCRYEITQELEVVFN